MTSSARDLSPAGKSGALESERLGELLSAIAEAPDLASAAAFFLDQLVEYCGAERGAVVMLSPAREVLEPVALRGIEDDEATGLRIELDRERHPLTASALALIPVQCDRHAASRERLPFPDGALILPFPQPQSRAMPAVIPERRLSELTEGCVAVPMSASRRMGHAPFGAVLLSGTIEGRPAAVLARAASFAGPVLARMAGLDELREAASRLDQQRDLLTAIVNSLPDPIVITDAENNIVVQNRRAEHLLTARDSYSEGRRRAVEINNLLFTSYLARAVMSTGGGDAGGRELNLVDPDEGTDLLFEVLAHPLPGDIAPDGAYISVLRDVTDLRRAAHELERQFQRVRLAEIEARRERDRLNLILENVADPILVTDDRSNILLMNRHAERLFQTPENQPHPSPRISASAIRGNDTKFTSFISDFAIGAPSVRREQMRLTDPETGVDLPVEVVSGKILNERGEAPVIVSVLHDLTKQVENERLYEELKKFSAELEERIREATADLAEQNARLQWQSEELAKANRLKSEFLASMSHELRTPINALIGYTSLMLDRIYGDLNERQEEGLRRIRTSAEHLLALINDILDLAKIEAGKMPLHYEEVGLALLATEITAQIEPMMRKKTFDYRIEIPGDIEPIQTDRTRVKQILLNLMSNAIKFTHEGSVILRVTQDAVSTRFDVIDTGIGIKSDDLEVIWEDFRQLDQSRTREYGGTGLGLSITRKLVAGLGGRIEVVSTFGKGSTFSVTLPRLPQREGAPTPSGGRVVLTT